MTSVLFLEICRIRCLLWSDRFTTTWSGFLREKTTTLLRQDSRLILYVPVELSISVRSDTSEDVLDHRYLIVDEAQNLTVTQALTLITRAGYGTKIVLCGDPDQIDAKYLDKRNNGLVFAAEKMKGSKYCAQITFDQEEAVRSDLAMEAVKRMTI